MSKYTYTAIKNYIEFAKKKLLENSKQEKKKYE